MKNCNKCGNELFDEAVICPACGCPQENSAIIRPKDSSNILWFIISFCTFWPGLILFLVWKDVTPKRAKLCLFGSLTVLVLGFVVMGIVMGSSCTRNAQEEGVLKGKNQLTEEMNEEVEAFKSYSDQMQQLTTIKIEVGEKTGIRTAWRDYKLYSKDTGVANIEGKKIVGISKGVTYVVVESQLGLRKVYKIIVK